MKQGRTDISVIICAYDENRWDTLVAAVESVQRQTLPPDEIIVVIDHNPALLKRAREHLPGAVVVENTEARGLRGARNRGISTAKGQIIAFLDDDARATDNWLRLLAEGYDDPQVLGIGGEILPLWMADRPAWMPEEFYWVVGCTYRGMPETDAPIRNLIGTNMSFRRVVFETVGYFRNEIGRIGPRHAGGCEETELCIRVHQYWPQSIFLYRPEARVFHCVPTSRTSWRYFRRRCYLEGLAKADVARYVGSRDGLSSEVRHTLHALPKGVLLGLKDAFFHLDASGFQRAGSIVFGFMFTTTGYVVGSMLLRMAQLKRTVGGKESLLTAVTQPLPPIAPPSLQPEAEKR